MNNNFIDPEGSALKEFLKTNPRIPIIPQSTFLPLIKDCGLSSWTGDFAETIGSTFGDNSDEVKLLIWFLTALTALGHLRIPADFEKLNISLNDFPFQTPLSPTLQQKMIQVFSDIPNILSRNPGIFGINEITKPILLWKKYFYFQKCFHFEQRLIRQLTFRMKNPLDNWKSEIRTKAFEATIDHSQKHSHILNEQQKHALNQALEYPEIIITGGPGTGKTTLAVNILRAILYAAYFEHRRIVPLKTIICAPTGRAQARLSEGIQQFLRSSHTKTVLESAIDQLLPEKGITLHRLLQSKIRNNNPGETYQIQADILIVDEASMIDFMIMTHLWEALPLHCRVIFLGDPYQIPSVEGGAVFNDLIPTHQDISHTLKTRHVELKQSMRFGKEIQNFARVIQEKDVVSLENLVQFSPVTKLQFPLGFLRPHQLFPLPSQWTENPETNTQILLSRLFPLKKPAFIVKDENESQITDAFQWIHSFKILCPHYEGPLGIHTLNQYIQKILGFGGKDYYSGMPIMIWENDYKNRLFNGDQGIILEVENHGLRAFFPGENGFRNFSMAQLPRYEQSFAMTIHKSQGSEFKSVMVVLPLTPLPMLCRELLYTAITRARKNLIVVSELDILKHTIQKSLTRNSGIRQFLTEG